MLYLGETQFIKSHVKLLFIAYDTHHFVLEKKIKKNKIKSNEVI